MNADISRQRKAATGKLFDTLGNSSVGELPRGVFRIKSNPTILPDLAAMPEYRIDVPDGLGRNSQPGLNPNAELKSAAARGLGLGGSAGTMKHPPVGSHADEEAERALEAIATKFPAESSPMLNELPDGGSAFCNLGMMNPVKKF